MIRPSIALWDKSYKEEMQRWVKWHVDNSTIDNLDEFMRGFMQFSRGTVNPQMVKETWNESKRRTEGASELVEGSLQSSKA